MVTLGTTQDNVAAVETTYCLEPAFVAYLLALGVILEAFLAPGVLQVAHAHCRERSFLLLKLLHLEGFEILSGLLKACLKFWKIGSLDLFFSEIEIMSITAIKPHGVSPFAITKAIL